MNRKTYANNKYVIDGSNARNLNSAAQQQPSYEESMNEWLRRREQKERQRRSDEARKRRLRKEMETRMDLGTFLFLMVAVFCAFYACVSYLSIQEQITNTSKKIASAEGQIIAMKNANQIALEKVDDRIDLSYVYKVATKELGMVHPGKEQVIKYQQIQSDYLKQYGDIPELKEENVIEKIVNRIRDNLG